ncbi:unnamed protein product [Victoria cruziana]
MATTSTKLAALFLSLNVLFFSCASACSYCKPNFPPVIPTPTVTTPITSRAGKCPVDALKLAACANVLGGLVNLVLGEGSKQCCSLLQGLADLDAAVCLCLTIKANLLGINLSLPLSLSLLLNECGRVPPADFKCA